MALLAVIGYSAAYIYGTARVASQHEPILVVNPADLNFGTVWATDEFSWKLRIRNMSRKHVVIDHIDASCTCAVLDGKGLEIGSGETKQVTLKIDLTSAVYHKQAVQPQPLEVQFRPWIKPGLGPTANWILRGEVVSAIDQLPPSLDFGQWVEGDDTSVPRIAQIIVPDVRDQVEITSQFDEASVRGGAVTPEDSRVRSLEVTFPRPRTRGYFRFPAVIGITGSKGEPKGRYGVVLTGLVTDDIYVEPRDLSFGIATPGSLRSETLIVASRLGRRFELLGAKAQGEGLSVEMPETETGAPYRLRVRYQAPIGQARGTLSLTIHVRDDRLGERYFHVHPAVHVLKPGSVADADVAQGK